MVCRFRNLSPVLQLLYNAGYYFLPIYLGWAAARQLGCSEQLGMMLGGVLIAPDLLKLVDTASRRGHR